MSGTGDGVTGRRDEFADVDVDVDVVLDLDLNLDRLRERAGNALRGRERAASADVSRVIWRPTAPDDGAKRAR